VRSDTARSRRPHGRRWPWFSPDGDDLDAETFGRAHQGRSDFARPGSMNTPSMVFGSTKIMGRVLVQGKSPD